VRKCAINIVAEKQTAARKAAAASVPLSPVARPKGGR
jgi:hypothetical protein